MNNRSLRVALSRIRLSSHLFMIERGRWGKNRLRLNERKCTLCGVLEDEFHCLFVCPRFNNEREWFMNWVVEDRPTNVNLINL